MRENQGKWFGLSLISKKVVIFYQPKIYALFQPRICRFHFYSITTLFYMRIVFIVNGGLVISKSSQLPHCNWLQFQLILYLIFLFVKLILYSTFFLKKKGKEINSFSLFYIKGTKIFFSSSNLYWLLSLSLIFFLYQFHS